MDRKKLKKARVRTTAAAAAVIAAAGAAVGGSFDTPAELLTPADEGAALVDSVFDDEDGGSTDGGEEETLPGKRRGRFAAWVLTLPAWLRALVGVPLWCIGWLVISFFSAMWGAVLSPFLSFAAKWVLAAALLLAALAAAVKLACPGVPLKTVLGKKTRRIALLGVAALWLLELALGYFLPERRGVRGWLGFAGTLAVFAAAAVPAVRAGAEHRREESARNDPPPETEEERQRRLRRLALEMADSAKDT